MYKVFLSYVTMWLALVQTTQAPVFTVGLSAYGTSTSHPIRPLLAGVSHSVVGPGRAGTINRDNEFFSEEKCEDLFQWQKGGKGGGGETVFLSVKDSKIIVLKSIFQYIKWISTEIIFPVENPPKPGQDTLKILVSPLEPLLRLARLLSSFSLLPSPLYFGRTKYCPASLFLSAT